MSTKRILSEAGVALTGLKGKVNVLAQAFPNLANVITNFTGSIRAGSGVIKSFKIALSGLWGIIKAHPVIATVTAVTALVGVINGASESAKESVRKRAEELRELATQYKEESDSLNDLIAKYQELARADRTDSSNRESIKEVQSEITELVGTQATNLDLVNGKLDEQLAKLKDISEQQLTDNISTYRDAYNTAKENTRQNSALHEGFWTDNIFGGSDYLIDYGLLPTNEGLKNSVENIIKDVIQNKYGEVWNGYGSYSFDFSKVGEDDFKSRIDAISEILNQLQKLDDFDTDTKLFSKLTTFRNELQNTYNEQVEQGSVLLDSLITSFDNSNRENGNIDSFDDYMDYRNEIIDKIKNDSSVSEMLEDNVFDENSIETEVDSYLGTLDEFSDYYNEWYNKFGSDVAKDVAQIKEAFLLDTYFDASQDPTKVKEVTDAFNNWIDNLSDSDKEIVYKISTDFTSENIENQLENFSDGGTVDLTLRPTVDNSELKKAGWDVSSDGTATVFTSTFSNADGSVAINFTPIVTDEKGNYKETLSPEALQEYAESVINGTREDDLKLQIGAEFTGDNAIDQSVKAAEKIHLLQDYFYLKGDPSNFSLDDWKMAVEDYKTYAEEIGESVSSAFEKLIYTKGDKDNPQFIDRVDDYVDSISTLNDAFEKFQKGELENKDIIKLIEDFPQLAGRTEDLDTAINELKGNLNNTMIADFDNQFGKMKTDEDVESLNALKDSVLNLTSEASEISKITAEIENLKDTLSDLKGTYDSITGIIDDYNENGYYTIDNLKSLLELEPAYINALIDENGQINLNSQSYRNYVAAKAKTLVVDQIKSLYENILAMSKEEVQAYANATAYKAESDSLEDLITTTTQYYMVLARAKDAENNTTVYTEGLQKSFGTVANYAAVYNSWLNSLSTSTNEFSTKTKEAKAALEKQKEALESQKDTLEDTKNGYENAVDSIKSLIDWTENYIKQTKEDEIDALEKKKQSVDDLIESQKELLQAQKDEYDWNKEIADKQNSVAKNALAASIASLDDSSAGKKAYKEAIDTLNESRSDMTDTLYEHSIDTRMDALDKLKEQSDKYYDDEIDKINEFLNDEVALYKTACSMIDNDNGTLYSNLLNYCKTYTTTSEAEFNHMWTSAQSAMQQYNIANLDTFSLLNDLQGRIYEVDGAIDTISNSISSYEDKISGVQSKLDGLSDSAQTAISNINAAIEASNNLGNNNKKINTTSFWVNYNGKKYQTGYNYSGDTNSNRLLAANELTKLIAKDVSGFDQYGLGIVQGLLGVGNEKSNSNNKFDNSALINGVSKDFNGKNIQPSKSNSSNTSSTNKSPYKLKFPHYAKGTRNSVGGLSITQEDGFEAIFQKLQNGEYTMMPKGSQVFNRDMTDNLYNFSADPQKFMSEIASKFNYSNYLNSKQGDIDRTTKQIASNYNQKNIGDININSPINIQGDATQSTVKALRAETDKIVDKATKNVMNIALRNKRLI